MIAKLTKVTIIKARNNVWGEFIMLPFLVIVVILTGSVIGNLFFGNQSEESGKHSPRNRQA